MHNYYFREKEISHCYSSTSLWSRSGLDEFQIHEAVLSKTIHQVCMYAYISYYISYICLACSILSEGKYFHREMNSLCHSFQTLLFEERKSCVIRSTWECCHVVLSEMTASYFVELLQKAWERHLSYRHAWLKKITRIQNAV